MKKWISILGALLVVQLLLVFTFNASDEEYGAYQASDPLLAFEPASVDTIRIGDGQMSVEMTRSGAGWQLPDQWDFPADSKRVDELLQRLAGLKRGWPVTTTEGGIKRFEVAAEGYQRQLTLLSGERELARLYVGTSPGYRKVHVRPADSEAVYGVEFNVWEANADREEWIDRVALQLQRDQLARLDVHGLSAQPTDGKWGFSDLAAGEQTDQEGLDKLIEQLTQLQFHELLGNQALDSYQLDEAQLTLNLTLVDGRVLNYRISKSDELEQYVLKRSDLDYYFSVSESALEGVIGSSREGLISGKPLAASSQGSVSQGVATISQGPELVIGEELILEVDASGQPTVQGE